VGLSKARAHEKEAGNQKEAERPPITRILREFLEELPGRAQYPGQGLEIEYQAKLVRICRSAEALHDAIIETTGSRVL